MIGGGGGWESTSVSDSWEEDVGEDDAMRRWRLDGGGPRWVRDEAVLCSDNDDDDDEHSEDESESQSGV